MGKKEKERKKSGGTLLCRRHQRESTQAAESLFFSRLLCCCCCCCCCCCLRVSAKDRELQTNREKSVRVIFVTRTRPLFFRGRVYGNFILFIKTFDTHKISRLLRTFESSSFRRRRRFVVDSLSLFGFQFFFNFFFLLPSASCSLVTHKTRETHAKTISST